MILLPWKVARLSALMRDMCRCQYCLAVATTVDHVWPKSRGGTHQLSNLLAACDPCNRSKGSMTLAEWVATGTAPTLAALTLQYGGRASGGDVLGPRCSTVGSDGRACRNQARRGTDLCGLHRRDHVTVGGAL